MTTTDLTALSATDTVNALRAGSVTPDELIDAAEARINEVDVALSAIPTRSFDLARSLAKKVSATRGTARNEASWLAGLPIVVKDLTEVAGVRSTFGGSPIFADNIPAAHSHEITRLVANGAIPIGMAASPEFGFTYHGHTYSQLFGYTRNPWNTGLTTAGSSGGSAAALASGMAWLATGSDQGGSGRIPAGFCGVVGLRPSPGLCPYGPRSHAYNMYYVSCPMGRTVADTALMLDAMVGHEPRDPLSFPPPVENYQTALDRDPGKLRVALSVDLGLTRCHSEIAALVRDSGRTFASLGAEVEETCPDFSDAVETFVTLRGFTHVAGMGELAEKHRDKLSQQVHWTVDNARTYTADQFGTAERARTRLYARLVEFLAIYDCLICPVSVVPPFPIGTRLERVEDHLFERYFDWMAPTFVISVIGLPAISVPCGFTSDGMPVGLQIIGRPRGERQLLQIAAAFERARGLGQITPIAPKAPAGERRTSGEVVAASI